MRYFYICAGNNICGRKGKTCYDGCYYSCNFFFSKLYSQSIKPSKPIEFIRDSRGDYWEVNRDWSNNLPVAFRSKPEEFIYKSYNDIEQFEIFQAARRAGNGFIKL